jgi:toxin ParE1/3/4
MTIYWSHRAQNDLFRIHAYLGENNPEAVSPIVDRLYAAGQSLEHFPERGRVGRLLGSRELVVESYVITYRVRRDSVRILAIEHGAMRR